ncbi:DUF4349 domain-containing protein [Leptospira sp. WS92.C1]
MKKTIIFILTLSLLFFADCGKKQEESKDSPTESTATGEGFLDKMRSAPMPNAEKKRAEKGEDESDKVFLVDKEENQLGKVFAPVSTSNERLLEYNIQLSYQCGDLVKTRKELLDFISKYGYLESSSAANSTSPYMTVKMHVRSEKLYEALLELDKLGNLLSEEISTVDHTEGMVWQKRKTTREKIRLARRNSASTHIGAAAKNWEAIEESVSNSEDELDLAEQETWKIKDRVHWATISVGFSIPTPPDAIQVPEYKNALVGILNTFLQFSYYLLWWLPFLILSVVFIYYGNILFQKVRKKIKG